MDICRISKGFPPRVDGWSTHAHMLSLHQARLGHRVVVLQPFTPSGTIHNVEVRRLRLGRFSRHLDWKSTTLLIGLLSVPVLRALRNEGHVDLVHVHGDMFEVIAPTLWARAAGLPIIVTLHSSLNRRTVYRVIARRVFQLVDGFICISPAVQADVLTLGVPFGRVAVISSGVDTRVFHAPVPGEREALRAELGLPPDDVLVVSVGRLHPVKGYRYLLDAAAGLQNWPRLRFIVIGDGPERTALQQRLDRLSHVSLPGAADPRSVARYLRAADIFVLPSVDLPGTIEGTPTALLEAMSTGLPVVCTNSGGMPHLITHEVNGLVVPQRDARSLAEAIARLAADATLRAQFGTRNREMVSRRDWSSVAARVIHFYEEMLHQRRVPAVPSSEASE